MYQNTKLQGHRLVLQPFFAEAGVMYLENELNSELFISCYGLCSTCSFTSWGLQRMRAHADDTINLGFPALERDWG